MTISNENTLVTSTTSDDTTRGIRTTPNDKGGNTHTIYGPPLPSGKPHFISAFQTGKDLIDFSDTLKYMGVESLNFNHSSISDIKNPGDVYLHWVLENNKTYIYVVGTPRLSITVEGQVRNGDIVGSGWT